MTPTTRNTLLARWFGFPIAAAVAAVLGLGLPFAGGQGTEAPNSEGPRKPAPGGTGSPLLPGQGSPAEAPGREARTDVPGKSTGGEAAKATASPASAMPGAVEIRFTDDSVFKLVLREERLVINTPYGKLSIPVADVRRIEFGTRLADDVAKRIETAIGNLGSREFKLREAASADLLRLLDKAYPALMRAAEHKDREVSRRAEELLDRIRQLVPEDWLEIRAHDVVYTDDSKIAGRIEGTMLKASTTQFGDVQVKLTDVRLLRSLAAGAEPEPKPAVALADPGRLSGLAGELGKRFAFRVTGDVNGSLWGTDTYTLDSSLATAAVHAGALKPGQTGVVRVKIVPSPAAFTGTTRHGVTSSGWGMHPAAFQIIK